MLKVTKTHRVMKFSEIPIGGLLEFNDTIYIKIQDLKYDRTNIAFNVVCLNEEDTRIGWFEPNDEVIYYSKAELFLSP